MPLLVRKHIRSMMFDVHAIRIRDSTQKPLTEDDGALIRKSAALGESPLLGRNPKPGRFLMGHNRLLRGDGLENPIVQASANKHANIMAVIVQNLTTRFPSGNRRRYSLCKRSVFPAHQPNGENCRSFGSREFTLSTIL